VKGLRYYVTDAGKKPFLEWRERLTEKTKARIDRYLERVTQGGAKRNIKPLGEGLCEIKIDTGPGYRCYFGEVDNVMILLLLGGDKSSQDQDIKKARLYWRAYHAKN